MRPGIDLAKRLLCNDPPVGHEAFEEWQAIQAAGKLVGVDIHLARVQAGEDTHVANAGRKKVAVIGHSGGGIILAGGLGSEPGFQPDLAVTIASVFNLPAWVAHRGFGNNWPTEKSISPHKFTAKVSPAVEVVVVSGSADTNALSEYSADYVDLMKRDGKNARHVDLVVQTRRKSPA